MTIHFIIIILGTWGSNIFWCIILRRLVLYYYFTCIISYSKKYVCKVLSVQAKKIIKYLLFCIPLFDSTIPLVKYTVCFKMIHPISKTYTYGEIRLIRLG